MRSEPPAWLVVALLGLTQIVGYGTLYYAFSILADAMAADLGWSTEWVFGALSAALLVGGLVAPLTGRRIDRHGAGRIMAIGSAVAAIALAACALTPGRLSFVLALVGVEVAATLVQYNAAFALLVQVRPQTAQRNITHLTLIAGFASTIFWPITTALHAHLSWGQVYLVFAALHLVLCLPIHAFLSRPPRHDVAGATSTAMAVPGSLAESARPRAFRLLVLGFALQGFVNAALLIHMLPLLAALGLGVAGVMVGSLFGPAQVLSRFVNMVFGQRLSQLILALISTALQPVAIIMLLLSAPSPLGAAAFALLFGLGAGLSSIVQGTLPLALFGSAGYGERQGQVTAARLVVSAAAPFGFAYLLQGIGISATLGVMSVLGGAAVLALYAIGINAAPAK